MQSADLQSFSHYPLTVFDSASHQVYVNFFLLFYGVDVENCLRLLGEGIDRLVNRLPFLSGDVFPSPTGQRSTEQIQPCPETLAAIPMYKVKHDTEPMAKAMDQLGLIIWHKAFCPLPPFLDPTAGRPVVRFQGTALSDGIILGVSFNHRVFDVVGIDLVFRSLAACCSASSTRTASPTSLPLDVDHDLPVRQKILDYRGEHCDDRARYAANYQRYCDPVKELGSATAAYKTNMYTFSSDRLARIKSMCHRLIPECTELASSSTSSISTSDVLNAILAICIQRSRIDGQAQPLSMQRPGELSFAVNLRPMLLLQFDAYRYFGNLFTVLQVNPSNALGSPGPGYPRFDLIQITNLALRIRQKLQTVDTEYVRQLGSYLDWQKDPIAFKFTDVSFTNHREWNLYDLDFGRSLGKIDALRYESWPIDGLCVVMPARRNDPASWADVLITSTPGVLDTLEKDPLIDFLLSEEQLVKARPGPTASARL